jgi:DNA-binding NarL/FixJ family response regulator
LVADDHEIVRRGLCVLLKSHTEWEVCAEAADGREAIDKTQQLKPDIVVLDIGMPNLNGLTATRQILQAQPNQKILILTITDEEQVIREILEAGARGFVLKSDAARDLVSAVEALQAGTMFFTSRVAEMVLRTYLNQKQDHSEDTPIHQALPRASVRSCSSWPREKARKRSLRCWI